MLTKHQNTRTYLLIVLISSLLFIPFLGQVHLFDWDEINFAESAREMIVSGDYLNVQINFELFWEKPPLFIWMQVVSMKVFGITEFAARFPNAVAGMVTLCFLFYVGKKQFDKQLGILWVIVYAGSLLSHLYFKSGIIDPWFNLFIFSGIYFFIRYLIEEERQTKFILVSAVLIGLGTLTKGPVALLLFLLSGFFYLVLYRFKLRISFKDILLYILTYAFVGGFWFILQLLSGNYTILHDFVVYQIELFKTDVAGHKGFPAYHFVILLIGLFPASIIALKSFKKNPDDNENQKIFKKWMLILFWVVLILFSIVKTKIIHYSSAAYFPLTFLAAYAIHKTSSGSYKPSKWITAGILFFTVFYAGVIVLLQYIGQHSKEIIASGLVKDSFTAANLEAETAWTGYEFLLGVFLITGIAGSLYFFRKEYIKRTIGIFITNLVFVNLTLLIIVPEVEKISQGSAIEFYTKIKDETKVISTFGYKSYAHYFYGNIKPGVAPGVEPGPGVSVYSVCKINKAEEFTKKHPDFRMLYKKNGFVFWERNEE
jgi:4-amino-4-deoxy-L-arabinose transferase-like glycosyltransferase